MASPEVGLRHPLASASGPLPRPKHRLGPPISARRGDSDEVSPKVGGERGRGGDEMRERERAIACLLEEMVRRVWSNPKNDKAFYC